MSMVPDGLCQVLSLVCVLGVEQELAANAVKQGSVKLAMYVEV